MEELGYESQIAGARVARNEPDIARPARARPKALEPSPQTGEPRLSGVPLTRRVSSAIESYSSAGVLASFFAFLGGALAYRAVTADAPICHPLAALSLIASVAVLVGLRIRLLSVLEAACIEHGVDEDEARIRARRALVSLEPGRRGDDAI
jgi:hypothetical protein